MASTGRGDLVEASRWLPRGARLPPTVSTKLVDYLETSGVQSAVLVPCSDELALQAAGLPADLQERFPGYLASRDALRSLVDKGEHSERAAAAGVPHPDTLLIQTAADLERLGDEELAASFIKPSDSRRFVSEFGVKGFRPSERSGFRSRLRILLEDGHRLMVQKYVPGPPSNHYFVDGFAREGGAIVAVLVRRRLRMYPPDFGNSTFMVTVPPDEAREAIDALARLLASVGFRGIFSAEFKRDEEDAVFKLIEVNARPWWYVEFAAQAGLDVVDMTYRAALGERVEHSGTYQLGRRLVFPYFDFHACRAEGSGILDASRRVIGVSVGSDQPIFAWRDPWPSVREVATRLTGAARRRLRPASSTLGTGAP